MERMETETKKTKKRLVISFFYCNFALRWETPTKPNV